MYPNLLWYKLLVLWLRTVFRCGLGFFSQQNEIHIVDLDLTCLYRNGFAASEEHCYSLQFDSPVFIFFNKYGHLLISDEN